MRPALKRLEMALRARVPDRLRRAYRVARAAATDAPVSQPLPTHLVEHCRMCASRYELLSLMPKDGVVAELGTWRGAFAGDILKRAAPRRLHLVDIDFSQVPAALLADSRVTAHQGLTHEVLAEFADATFDWIYVDADHSYDGAMRDARAAAAKLKPGGYLLFNDFAHIDPGLGRYGVHRAVVDFMLAADWPMVYFALQTSALYDVALRKPG